MTENELREIIAMMSESQLQFYKLGFAQGLKKAQEENSLKNPQGQKTQKENTK